MKAYEFMNTNLSSTCESVLSSLSENGDRPRLLLHACCAPCSSYVTEYLEPFFDLTVFFYNPNISPEEEFNKRYSELSRFIDERFGGKIEIICPPYDYDEYLSAVQGLFDEPEGGERCAKCFFLRLEAAARTAAELGFPWFCTTLSVSPYKNASLLYQIGSELGSKYGVNYLPSDFKKKDGYKRSIELSKEYGLYRQDFCGCPFSLRETNNKKQNISQE